jgi:hypothetical protein
MVMFSSGLMSDNLLLRANASLVIPTDPDQTGSAVDHKHEHRAFKTGFKLLEHLSFHSNYRLEAKSIGEIHS